MFAHKLDGKNAHSDVISDYIRVFIDAKVSYSQEVNEILLT